jgi:hypothetical protein
MVVVIEKELETKEMELKELLGDLTISTTPDIKSKVNCINAEKEILHKLLNQRKLHRRSGLFAFENGLLLFAITLFGALAVFVVYLVFGTNAVQGTWEHMGSEMAVLIMLLIMTGLSTALYLQHYKHKLG